MDDIRANILSNTFTQNVDNINVMLSLLKNSHEENYKLKVLLSHMDIRDSRKGVPFNTFNALVQYGIREISTYDKLISEVWVPVKAKKTTFTYNHTDNTYKYTNDLVFIPTIVNLDLLCKFYFNLYKSTGTVIENPSDCINYQRIIGKFFEFKNPQLSNWLINVYGVYKTAKPDNKKLYKKLEPFECYSTFHIEFKIKEVAVFVINDVLKLIEVFFKKDFYNFNLTYNILNKFYFIDYLNIPENKILTQSDITKPINDYFFIANRSMETCLLITYNNRYYKLTKKEFTELFENDVDKEIDSVNAFVCKCSEGSYFIVDCLVLNGKSLINPLTWYYDRVMKCSEFYNNNNELEKYDIFFEEPITFNSWDEVNELVIDNNSLICIDPENTLEHNLITSKIDVSIKFLVKQIPFTHSYCLYVVANGSEVINSKIFFNAYSQSHMGYTITPSNNALNKFAIFDTPYFDTFITDLSLITTEIINEMHYSKQYKKKILKFIEDIISEKININDMLIEFTIISYKDKYFWIPLPEDSNCKFDYNDENKLIMPSEYKQALLLSSSIYTNRNFKSKENVLLHKCSESYQAINDIINKYITEKFINPFKHENVIDAFNENNYFVKYLFKIGYCKNIIALNANKYPLINYVNNLLETKLDKKQMQFIMTTTKNEVNLPAVNLKLFVYDLTAILNNIYHKLLAISSFKINNINIFILADNVEEVFNNFINIINLSNLMDFCLANDGKLIIKYTNNDSISSIRKDYKAILNNTFDAGAYSHDKFITELTSEHKVRYKGKDYDIISTGVPLYANVVYNHIPEHCFDLTTEHFIGKLFNCNVHYAIDVHHRLFNKWVGLCKYDLELGAIDLRKNDLTQNNVLITSKEVNEDLMSFIESRTKINKATVIITESLIECAVRIHKKVFVILPQKIHNKTDELTRIFYNLNIEDIAKRCYYDKVNTFKIPMQDIIFYSLPALGYELDVAMNPYIDDFFNKYITSLNYELTREEIKELKKITVASFMKV